MPVAAVTYDFLSPGRGAAKGATGRPVPLLLQYLADEAARLAAEPDAAPLRAVRQPAARSPKSAKAARSPKPVKTDAGSGRGRTKTLAR